MVFARGVPLTALLCVRARSVHGLQPFKSLYLCSNEATQIVVRTQPGALQHRARLPACCRTA